MKVLCICFRDSLAFATEPVFASLSNVFEKHENFSSGMPSQLKVSLMNIISLFLFFLKKVENHNYNTTCIMHNYKIIFINFFYFFNM